MLHAVALHLLVSVLLALAPPPALREPLEEEEPSESEEELLMLSLSWPRPQDVAAQLPRSGLRLRVGELSEVVSGALLSMLAIPAPARRNMQSRLHAAQVDVHPHGCNLPLPVCFFFCRTGEPQQRWL